MEFTDQENNTEEMELSKAAGQQDREGFAFF